MAILQYMDEILIEEKKYVSSKQAAKITGYAKDYVGQLCREGRVPARLVGRSWYVLESAIQDHRFGNPEIESEDTSASAQAQTESQEFSRSSTMPEVAKYEPAYAESLPALSKSRETAEAAPAVEEKNLSQEDLQSLHDSWKEWFDHVREPLSAAADVPAQEVAAPEEGEKEIEPESEAVEEEVAEEIPLHVLRQSLPVETVSANVGRTESRARSVGLGSGAGNKKMVFAAQVAGVLVALASAALAIAGSGYFDTYLISANRVQAPAGIHVLNK